MRKKRIFGILAVGAVVAILAEAAGGQANRMLETAQVMRPGYGEGTRETELSVSVEGGEEYTIPILLDERQYSEEEIEKVFEDIAAGLDGEILGENSSLDEVRTDLKLPQSFADGAVSAEWYVMPENILDDTGAVIGDPPEEGVLTELQVVLRYGDREREYSFFANIFPPVRTGEEAVLHEITTQIAEAESEYREEERLELPREVKGKKLEWRTPEEHKGVVIFLLSVCAAALVYVQEKKEKEKKAEERRRGLILEYPELLFSLTLLLRAGMTIRAAFLRTAAEYKKQKGDSMQYVCEEMLIAASEMERGVPEAEVYERFGKRCGERCYVKLGTLLAQNLKKGSKGLTELLEAEAGQAMEERRALAKRLGEEAGTKLLLPMMMMFLIVLVILTVPVVLSFS